MIIVFSILAGIVWGGLFGLLNILITKKVAAGDEKKIPALSMIRTLADVAALAARSGEGLEAAARRARSGTRSQTATTSAEGLCA